MLDVDVDPWDELDADDERRRAREDREHCQIPAIGALVIVGAALLCVLLGSAWPMLLAPIGFLVALTVTD